MTRKPVVQMLGLPYFGRTGSVSLQSGLVNLSELLILVRDLYDPADGTRA